MYPFDIRLDVNFQMEIDITRCRALAASLARNTARFYGAFARAMTLKFRGNSCNFRNILYRVRRYWSRVTTASASPSLDTFIHGRNGPHDGLDHDKPFAYSMRSDTAKIMQKRIERGVESPRKIRRFFLINPVRGKSWTWTSEREKLVTVRSILLRNGKFRCRQQIF